MNGDPLLEKTYLSPFADPAGFEEISLEELRQEQLAAEELAADDNPSRNWTEDPQ